MTVQEILDVEAVFRSKWDEPVFIPETARSIPFTTFPMSARLRHTLGYMGASLLGDLHGRPFSQIIGYRRCGKLTLEELRELVHGVQREHGVPVVIVQWNQVNGRMLRVLCLPGPVRLLNPFQLPLSVRLEKTLRRLGVRCLGDLEGVSLETLRKVPRCGAKTVGELIRLLNRAAGGEFLAPEGKDWQPADLVRLLDELMAELPDRSRHILHWRLGAEDGKKNTLQAIASYHGVTIERVRQIVDRSLKYLRQSGSIRLNFHLKKLGERCGQSGEPLRPALLTEWLASAPVAPRHRPVFYFRLIESLQQYELGTAEGGFMTG